MAWVLPFLGSGAGAGAAAAPAVGAAAGGFGAKLLDAASKQSPPSMPQMPSLPGAQAFSPSPSQGPYSSKRR